MFLYQFIWSQCTWAQHRYGCYQIINMCFALGLFFIASSIIPTLQYLHYIVLTCNIKIMGNNGQTIIRALPHLTLHTGVIISIILTDIRQCNLTSGRAGGRTRSSSASAATQSSHWQILHPRAEQPTFTLCSDPHVRWCTVNWQFPP